MTAIEDGDWGLGELWAAHAPRLHAYARRHADAADVEDLVAEAYLVAFRRISDVPAESGEAFAWLWHTEPGSSPEDLVAELDRIVGRPAAMSDEVVAGTSGSGRAGESSPAP